MAQSKDSASSPEDRERPDELRRSIELRSARGSERARADREHEEWARERRVERADLVRDIAARRRPHDGVEESDDAERTDAPGVSDAAASDPPDGSDAEATAAAAAPDAAVVVPEHTGTGQPGTERAGAEAGRTEPDSDADAETRPMMRRREPSAPADADWSAGPPTQALTVIPSIAPAAHTDPVVVARALLERWEPAAGPTPRLARILAQPDGLDLVHALLDDVVRPEDAVVAGYGLSDLGRYADRAADTGLWAALRTAAFVGPGVPYLAAPAARGALLTLFGGEVVRSTRRLATPRLRADEEKAPLSVQPLTPRILGEDASRAFLDRALALIADPAIDEVVVRTVDLARTRNLLDFDGTCAQSVASFSALCVAASQGGSTPTRLQLRASDHDDLELTVETFMRTLDAPQFLEVEATIGIPAEYPEAADLVRRLTGWAHLRREDFGAPVTVAITRDGDRGAEAVAAEAGGLGLACYPSDVEVDANALGLIDDVLAPEHMPVLRLEVDGAERADAAWALALATVRNNPHPVRVSVSPGAGDAIPRRFADAGGKPVLRAPLAPDGDLRAAKRYLLRRCAQLRRTLRGEDDVDPWRERFDAALDARGRLVTGQAREQERVHAEDSPGVTAAIEFELFPASLFEDEAGGVASGEATELLGRRVAHERSGEKPGPAGDRTAGTAGTERVREQVRRAREDREFLTEAVLGLRESLGWEHTFAPTPATDLSLEPVRRWAKGVQLRIQRSQLGVAEAAQYEVGEPEAIGRLVERARRAGAEWGRRHSWDRAAMLEALAKSIEANRARLIEAGASETGLTFGDLDADVTRAVDLANYAAQLARELGQVQGALVAPRPVTAVLPDWIPPVSGIADGVFQALAAGSAAVVVAAPTARRTAALLCRSLWLTDLPDDVLRLAIPAAGYGTTYDELAGALVSDARVDQTLFQGDRERFERIAKGRPGALAFGHADARSCVVVTPSADFDDAASALVRLTCRAAGQLALRPSVAVLVGSVGRSTRFAERLSDAFRAVRVGYPSDAAVELGPLVQGATIDQIEELGDLDEGQRWLVEPRRLDDTGRLWTPGVRVGIDAERASEVGGLPVPVLNLVRVATLDEAIEVQHRLAATRLAALYSLDIGEAGRWIEDARAGVITVNADPLRAQPERRPQGGWGAASIGARTMSGGANALLPLCEWLPEPPDQSQTLHLRGLAAGVQALIESAQPQLRFEAFEQVRQSALSAQLAWNVRYGRVRDEAGMRSERNLLRYLSAATIVRADSGTSLTELLEVLAAGIVARSRLELSTAEPVSDEVAAALARLAVPVEIASDDEFRRRVARGEFGGAERIRLIGDAAAAERLRAQLRTPGAITVVEGAATGSGRIEVLRFLREQAISIAATRDGFPDSRVDALFPDEDDAA